MTQGHIEVLVDIGGVPVLAGSLWVHEGGTESATFGYADAYLDDPRAYDLAPALPRSAGEFHTAVGHKMFSVFADSAPDRWGRALMGRGEKARAGAQGQTPRSLREADYLLGVRDDTRQGAIRFRVPGGQYCSTRPTAVPKLVDLGRLLHGVEHLDKGGQVIDADLGDLIDAGSSLGGARPKAGVLDTSGRLAIAKFPRNRSDEWSVSGWEKLTLDLASRAGIDVAPSRLVPVLHDRDPVLVVDRFDRDPAGRRIGFASALTMLEAGDRERRSYLEIADVIERLSLRPGADLAQLYRRIVFSILVANTDDHLRNHAFLRTGSGWALAPAYDLNPNPESPSRLSTAITLDDRSASIENALSVARYFRLSEKDAASVVREVEAATREWRVMARSLGLRADQADVMASALDTDQRRIAATLSAPAARRVRPVPVVTAHLEPEPPEPTIDL